MSTQKQDTKKQKKKSKAFKIFKILIIILLSLTIIGGVAAAGITLAIIKTAPKLDLNAVLTLDEPSVLYYKTKDNKDEIMDEAPTVQKREIVSYKDIPKNLVNAFVSVEDERFWQHNGIDIRRIVGAALIDVQKIVKKETGMHGASTITQQLLKNTLLNNEFTLKRKIQEAYLATELEKALSKEQILEAYMNTIGLGGNINGVQKAAETYFGKNVKDLDLIQCAFIAGVTQNPSKYYPYSQKNQKDPTPYLDRTKTVLYTMHKNGYINDATYNSAIGELDSKKKIDFVGLKPAQEAHKLKYEWFSRPVMDAVKKDLMSQYHYSADEADTIISNGGLKIYTTMDKDLQDATQKIFDDNKNFGLTEPAKDAKSAIQPQSSAVIMDEHTGEVKVIIGGRGEQQAASMNRATSSQFARPTGSSLKPLSVYAPSIDTKKATGATMIEDSPLPAEIGNQWKDNGKPWNPQNYSVGSFQGNITLREALRRSTNLVAIKLEYQLGLKTGAAYAEKFGIPLTDSETKSLAALSLGQIKGTNTLTMAAAYATFGNSGVYTEPKLYTKVIDKSGRVVLESKTETRKILSPQSAYVMYDLLKEPTSGKEGATAGAARFGSMPVAGKTGTTSDNKDFWFTGLTPYYSGAVWIGNDIPKTYGKPISSSLAASVWSKIMAEAHKGLQAKDIERPSGLQTASVCSESGKIPTEACYKANTVYEEVFIDGTMPTTLCDVHTGESTTTPSKTDENTTVVPGTGTGTNTNTNSSTPSQTNNSTDKTKGTTSSTTNNSSGNTTTDNSSNSGNSGTGNSTNSSGNSSGHSNNGTNSSGTTNADH